MFNRIGTWIAVHGPRPYWLALRWSSVLAGVGIVVVLLNTLVFTQALGGERQAEWLNAVVAWVNSVALYMAAERGFVRRVASWRARKREQLGIDDDSDRPPGA